ncbi:MAG: formate dehydrogenase accessory sulfurtransferase FdhD [Anaerolineales bacterium]|nr:formate dehydrogenase accessory sulfurtransferase FdhD [Anaerolineales bacterium]
MSGTKPITYLSINGREPLPVDGEVVEEALACVSVNGRELATMMCSPHGLEQLALGFLYNEGIIGEMADVRHLRVSEGRTCVDVWLQDAGFEPPTRQIVTAGCGGGVTFDDLQQQHAPLDSALTAAPAQLAELMRRMHLGAELYQRARGIHTAVLADQAQILLQVEDVGRHNCLDKLAGAALQQGIDTRDKLLFTSGRISSEMLNKARRLGTPIVCSRTSPTSLSVALAEAWHITIVAYLRQDRMRIYTHPERIVTA